MYTYIYVYVCYVHMGHIENTFTSPQLTAKCVQQQQQHHLVATATAGYQFKCQVPQSTSRRSSRKKHTNAKVRLRPLAC